MIDDTHASESQGTNNRGRVSSNREPFRDCEYRQVSARRVDTMGTFLSKRSCCLLSLFMVRYEVLFRI